MSVKVATHEWVKDLLKKIKARGGFGGGGAGTQGPPGPQGPAGADGFSPAITAATVPEGVRLTITTKSGQSTATVPKGADGATGPPGPKGADAVAGFLTEAQYAALPQEQKSANTYFIVAG